MFEQYLPIFALLGIAILLAIVLATLSRVIGPYRPNKIKLMPYESGMDPVGQAKERYSIAFSLVAMDFIVSELEAVFLLPWAVRFMEHSAGTCLAMFILITILFIGLVYTLRKGTLDWDVKNFKYDTIKQL